MKISVIIPTFQSEDVIAEAIDSVLAQSDVDTEILIIDGGSRDQTLEIVGRYGDKIAQCISEPDKGVCDAWNKGIALASGDYLYFLGSDDSLHSPYVFETFRHSIANLTPQPVIAYGRVELITQEGTLLEIRGQPWDGARSVI